MSYGPTLETIERDGVHVLTDPAAADVGVVVGFTDRRGGSSAAPWDSLDLSLSVGDDDEAVRSNRERAARAVGVARSSLRFVHQVHGKDVLRCGLGTEEEAGEADALASDDPEVTLSILTADCVPVLIAGEHAVAAAHAGWRGLVAGVVEAALDSVGTVQAAWVGPSIHACCYEVGPEVVESFRAAGLPVADASHVDPGEGARYALQRAGVEQIAFSTICTSCDENFFSYRRDGVTGRQGAFIARTR
jgi:YfiH family protein